MLQYVRQDNIVVAHGQFDRFEGGTDEFDPVTKSRLRFLHGKRRSLHASHIAEVRQQPFREITLETAQFQQAALLEEWLERFDHVWMHHVEIEAVYIFPI